MLSISIQLMCFACFQFMAMSLQKVALPKLSENEELRHLLFPETAIS